jgi:RNA polymerase sigma factor (sigma-70 family)
VSLSTGTTQQETSREDRLALIRRAKSGDHAAFKEYLHLNTGLFERTVGRYRRWAVDKADVNDMRQEGLLGLMKGIEKYDVDKSTETNPEGYVFQWVRAYVANYARGHGIGPASMFVSESVVSKDDEEGSVSLFDAIPDENADVDQAYRARELEDMFVAAEKHLLPKERVIAKRRLFCDEPDTLEAIGADMGVSRERIRQIETEIREKLYNHLHKQVREANDEFHFSAPEGAARTAA